MLLRKLGTAIASAGILSHLADAAPPRRDVEESQTESKSYSCNTATDRACWTPGFDINTDWEQKTPLTGVTRTYTFTITEIPNYVGADGQTKELAMLINNQFPGPVIQADWGDRINITVINNLQTNGTSFHWHGLRQLNNNIADGSNGITECPIPPGAQKTYSFLAAQYGTSWYHSHYSSQYANGLAGSILINGPASLPYDIDLGAFPISDWYYGAADRLLARVMNPNNPFVPGAPGSPPPSDNVFFNGTNINPSGPGGNYSRVKVTPGKRHRLRLINTSVENTFTVSIVNHQMTVIENDFVPVQAFTAQSLYLGIGQRYDVTIDASQNPGNFWINVTFSGTAACGSSNNPHPAAILTYEGIPEGLPTDLGTPPAESRCEDLTSLVPIVPRTVPAGLFTGAQDQQLAVTLDVDTAASRVFWKVNGSAMDVIWEKPTLEFILQANSSFPSVENVINIPDTSEWSLWLIQNVNPIPHPMHLHGHDFVILGRSPAPENPFAPTAAPVTFNPATDLASLKLNNPIRRDATMLPSFGWLAVAFQNDNPGAWLFHCHIAWHVSQGLSVQFLEKRDQIASVMDLNSIEPNCDAWRKYVPTDPFQKVDSGI